MRWAVHVTHIGKKGKGDLGDLTITEDGSLE
jgi:hypothetical protein